MFTLNLSTIIEYLVRTNPCLLALTDKNCIGAHRKLSYIGTQSQALLHRYFLTGQPKGPERNFQRNVSYHFNVI